MKNYIQQANKIGFSFIGVKNGKLMFTKQEQNFEISEISDIEKMSLYEVDMSKLGEDKTFSEDDLEEKDLKMADEELAKKTEKKPVDSKKEVEALKTLKAENEKLKNNFTTVEEKCKMAEVDKEELAAKVQELETEKAELSAKVETCEAEKVELSAKIDTYETDKTELSAKVTTYEAEKVELSAKVETAESQLQEIKDKRFKDQTDSILDDDDSEIDEKTKEDLKKMREDKKFTSVEEFVKELAYREHLKKEEKKTYAKKLQFSLNSFHENKPTVIITNPDLDALDEI